MPTELLLQPESTALVLIDLQNAIVTRDCAPYSAAQVVDRARSMVNAFRAKDALLVFVHVLFDQASRRIVDQQPSIPHNLPASAMEIAPATGYRPGDPLISKTGWGAFAKTGLETLLRDHGIDTIVIGGISTNLGVESTVREGADLGFNFVIVEDACSTFTAEMQEFAFKNIYPRLGRIRTTQQVLDALL